MARLDDLYSVETLACLVIDDPLLTPRYGCLDYEKLLQEMKNHNFFTEIAFIPWNYRRSDPTAVRLLADNPDYYALCVHGCNHTGNEFGGQSYSTLSALASTALWRMEQHKALTSLPYDPIMVFPQGRFSSVAMRALRDIGYAAACNSTTRATDRDKSPDSKCQRPATMAYHDFPLFLRRYPVKKAHFVQDIAAGRPIVIVEHHSAFRHGYETITDLVDWINGLGKIRWTSLLNITEHYFGQANVATSQIVNHQSISNWRLNARVALRHLLFQARDNYVDTSGSLARVYKMLHG